MSQQRRLRRACRGMTLVELLMVVTIMTILMAVAIPMIRPAFQNRVLREASRQINAFFAGASARAAATGRPVGVWIEAYGDPGGPYATRLYMAEIPPMYTGEILDSRVMVNAAGQLVFDFPPPLPPLPSLFDGSGPYFIRFDHKGPKYRCEVSGGSIQIVDLPNGIAPPGTDRLPGLTFEISRSPTKSLVNPLTLPGDAVIDLTVSGVGVDDNSFALASPSAPVIIMFTPSGQVGQVYVNQASHSLTGAIFLLIGRRSKMIPPAQSATATDPELSNLVDPANLWVTINHRTGAITTEDNSATVPATTIAERLALAREFAQGSRQKGGR